MRRRSLMFSGAGLGLAAAVLAASAQTPAPAPGAPPAALDPAFRAEVQRAFAVSSEVSVSSTRQFTIHAAPRTGWLPQLGNNTNVIRLQRELLAVSCERVKAALLTRLGLPDQWRGRILLELYPARNLDQVITVNSVLTGREWTYRVELPDTLERERLAAALVELLLRECANRTSGGRNVEIPAWLSAGLARDLLQSTTADLLLDPPNQNQRGVTFHPLLRDQRRPDALARSREQLLRRPPLTFAELSWPPEDQFTGANLEAFRASSQLFVDGLLEFPDGPACLRAFLAELPRHLNWQLAFRNAFQGRFAGTLAVEKWWALRVVAFTGRDLDQTLGWAASGQSLDELLRTPVEIRTRPDELPLRSEVSLQTILNQWDLSRQDSVLGDKIQQLTVLRSRVAQEVVHLVDDYRQVLVEYQNSRNPNQHTTIIRDASRSVNSNHLRSTVRALDQLDARRAQLRQAPPAAAPGEAPAAAGRARAGR